MQTWRNLVYSQPYNLLAVLLACMNIGLHCTANQAVVPACEGMKIGILDLNDLSAAAGVPQCSLNNVHVRISNGIVYTTSTTLEAPVTHDFGTHSGPWYLRGAILSSKYYTAVLEEADIIFVYDYCHYIHWLGYAHGLREDEFDIQEGPGDILLALYSEMMKMPVWKKFNGGQFALYDPHPGFFQGAASFSIQNLRCGTFKNAIHMIVDTPMRNVCEEYWQLKKILVTPYVPNPLEESNPRAYLQLPFRPKAERPKLGYCRSTCFPWEPPSTNTGKLMRYWFSYKEWGNDPEMDVRCLDGQLSSEGMVAFEDMFDKMRSSIFCPVFPGDAASTRRLSEIFLAGCIPVFLGPPYHSMPFSEMVPYKDAAIFFNISETSHWLPDSSPEWYLHPDIRAVHETEARWWVLDADMSESLIHVQKASDVLPKLKAIPSSTLEAKLRMVYEHGTRFSFLHRLTEPPSAGNSLMAGMCMKQTQHPGQLTLQ